MGWTPWKISYASNYFDRLHELAVQLIKAGKAFVCHQVGVWVCGWTEPCRGGAVEIGTSGETCSEHSVDFMALAQVTV